MARSVKVNKKKVTPPNAFQRQANELDKAYNTIKGYFQKWIPLLGLENWSIKDRYHMTFKDGGSGNDTLADAGGYWEYMSGHVNFYLPAMIDASTDWESVVIHELCHFVVMEMRNPDNPISPHEERVVSMLENAFMRIGAEPKKK